MKNSILLLLAGVLLAVVPPAYCQDPPAQDKQDTQGKKEEAKDARAPTTSVPTPAGAEDPSYRIGAQDVLRVDVWREDQLTRTVPVRPDGKITLPLLNDVQAAGLTPMELAGAIREELKKFITNPQVTVSVTEINSRRIYVNGEVNKSGAYQMLPHMTVLQALSGSGGFTAFARIKNIYVLRNENGRSSRIPFNYKEAIKGKNPEQNIELQPGDVVVVP
ncbi:MAG TPA: polysaccharide biosynthesis/export family protein [Candidatus Acidoferrum sp.]|nr:polysaccharide biosynthesis/export family protein [Candidatus Acidoferrum sp.]